MKLFACAVFAVAAACLLASGSRAEDKKHQESAKETTLKGSLVCAKCTLKEKGVSKCTNAIQVKEGDKTITYLLDDKGTKESYHDDICGNGKKKEVTVTGIVSEKDGKKWIKPSKVEVKKA